MARGVDDPGQGCDTGHWGSNDWRRIDSRGNSRVDWRSHDLMVDWRSHNRPHNWRSHNLMMTNSRPEDWSVNNWSHMMEGWGQDGVGRGVGNGPNDGLPLASSQNVSLGVLDFGSVDFGSVDGSYDGGGGGDWEGVGGHSVSIVIRPVMSREWNPLGANVRKGP